MKPIALTILLGLLTAGGCQTETPRPSPTSYSPTSSVWGNFKVSSGAWDGYQLTSPEFSATSSSGTVYQPKLGNYSAPTTAGYSPVDSGWSSPDLPSYRALDDDYRIEKFNYQKVKPTDNPFFAPPKSGADK